MLKLVLTQPVEQTQGFECAAWYETWQLQPGSHELTQGVDPYNKKRVFFVAKCPAVLESDYFQSLLCGNAIGQAYDTKQNAGKTSTRSIAINRYELLLDARLECTDDEYDALLNAEIDTLDKDLRDDVRRWQEYVNADGITKDWHLMGISVAAREVEKLENLLGFKKEWDHLRKNGFKTRRIHNQYSRD